jgi:hypothetical protein
MIELAGMFGPEAACRATGLSRDVFTSWLTRKYVDVRSRGVGRARRFTFEQVVRVAVTSELANKFSIRVAAAAQWSDKVRLPIADDGDFLLVKDQIDAIVVHLNPGESIDHAIHAIHAIAESSGDSFLQLMLMDFDRISWIMVDISKIAARVRRVLSNPDDPGPSYDWGSDA